jgi:hypothetical protein
MSLSMYQASVPVFLRSLVNLSAVLDKAMANANVQKIDQTVFFNARLAPDMLPLSEQVLFVMVHAKGVGARLAGLEVPNFDDTETTMASLQIRIAKTVKFLQGLTAAQIDGSEDRPVVLNLRGGKVSFTGQDYLLNFALPNFYFHHAITYAILRHNGVEIGKADYLGDLN